MSTFIALVDSVATHTADISVTDLATRERRVLGAAELVQGVTLAAGDRVLATTLDDTGGVAIIRRLPPLPA